MASNEVTFSLEKRQKKIHVIYIKNLAISRQILY